MDTAPIAVVLGVVLLQTLVKLIQLRENHCCSDYHETRGTLNCEINNPPKIMLKAIKKCPGSISPRQVTPITTAHIGT